MVRGPGVGSLEHCATAIDILNSLVAQAPDRAEYRLVLAQAYRVRVRGLLAYQDEVNALETFREFQPEFKNYDQYIEQETRILKRLYQLRQRADMQRMYFYNVVYPLVFRAIRTSILEYQFSPWSRAELLNA